MKTGFVAHNKLSHVAGGIRQNGIILPLGAVKAFVEELIELTDERFGSTEELNEIGHVVLHLPVVGPGIIFVIIVSRAQSTRKNIVKRLYEVTVSIFGMEEEGLRMKQMAIVEGATIEILLIGVLSGSTEEASNGPVIITRGQSDGYSLAFFARYLATSLFLVGTQSRKPAMFTIKIVEHSLVTTIPGYHGLGENRFLHGLGRTGYVEGNAFGKGIAHHDGGMVAIHAMGITKDAGEGGHPTGGFKHAQIRNNLF